MVTVHFLLWGRKGFVMKTTLPRFFGSYSSHSPRAPKAPTDSFMRACVSGDPEVGAAASQAYSELGALYGKSFILSFYNPEGALIVSHLIEGVNDVRKAITSFRNRPSAASVEAGANQHTVRR